MGSPKNRGQTKIIFEKDHTICYLKFFKRKVRAGPFNGERSKSDPVVDEGSLPGVRAFPPFNQLTGIARH